MCLGSKMDKVRWVSFLDEIFNISANIAEWEEEDEEEENEE